jgi:hypothetical protein
MDAMAVEGEGRIPEQPHGGRFDPEANDALGLVAASRLARRYGWRVEAAVDDVMLLDDGGTAVIREHVLDDHEDEVAASARLELD